ncbi:prenyltransferase/squalene oxidase repeat-containing protein [Methanobacterium oryzae]|uniref:prenyltransferase/squalene oxidase repeat-containing protein n=1 Tax=Methanobacterium oryzae TaxID=69540 RepID=UPI003D226F0F
MNPWQRELKLDPVPNLLSLENKAITYFAKRDLLDERVESIETLWKLRDAEKILRKQQSDGSWEYPGGKGHIRSQENYNQIETYRNLRDLVEKYGFTKKHEAIESAAEFFFRFQTGEGDFRGIYGTQYTPTYTPAIMELLIKAGYENDPHILKGFEWLLSIKQDDGGWAIPLRTAGKKLDALNSPELIHPVKSKPFSHLVTGMVLRAFATHPKYRKSESAEKAGELLISRFFKSDKYSDRRSKDFWEKVSYPFWFTDIISSLDSLSFIGLTRDNSQIAEALKWLKNRQTEDGLFNLKIVRGADKDLPYWICLAVCRLFNRYYE